MFSEAELLMCVYLWPIIFVTYQVYLRRDKVTGVRPVSAHVASPLLIWLTLLTSPLTLSSFLPLLSLYLVPPVSLRSPSFSTAVTTFLFNTVLPSHPCTTLAPLPPSLPSSSTCLTACHHSSLMHSQHTCARMSKITPF